ncbi:hypothetical protein [Virgibacillus sp. CBA3643]|uniref:hypothetical protein n=1 Tax=Virgibacillus sp. CBA3643 TaxID=2942278 RepID=UPI0035A2BE89
MKLTKTALTLLLASGIVLSGCGDQEEKAKNNTKNEDEMSQAEWMEENHPEEMEESNEHILQNEVGKFTSVGVYGNDQVDEEGFYKINFDGFKLNVSTMLTDIELTEQAKQQEKYQGKDSVRAVLMYMKAENTNDFEVDFNGTTTVVTSDKEQLSADYGVMSENEAVGSYIDQVKREGYFIIPIEDAESKPKSLKVILEPPYKVEDGAVDPVNGVLGEEKRVEFEFIEN